MNGIKNAIVRIIDLNIKEKNMMYSNKTTRTMLKESLLQLDKRQLKQFYGILVHAWASQKAFISSQNFHNLWCELNYCCAQVDESFPAPYDDYELLLSFCHTHPYYFIDILSPELIINLFCRFLDNKLDVLIELANKLRTEDIKHAYTYLKEAICLTESIDELVAQAEEHINIFS